MKTIAQLSRTRHVLTSYDTAQFKLHTRVYLVTPVEHL